MGSTSGSAAGTFVVKQTRTMSNVRSPGTYKVSVSTTSESVKISVEGATLTFSQTNERKIIYDHIQPLSCPIIMRFLK